MTITEMLQADGLSAEEISVLTGNPKYAASLEKMRARAEEGTTQMLKAQQLNADIEKFNNETVIPYGTKKDHETAAAQAELAKHKSYLKSLKDSGYDIPDAYLTDAPEPVKTVVEPTRSGISTEDLDKQGRAYMSLMSMSEKARDLLGHGLDIESEYDDFGKNKRPREVLRDYITRKYDLTSKQAAKDAEKQAAATKKIEDAAIEKYKAEHPSTADPDRATPRPSKFDRLANLDTERKQLWQTSAGRDQATKDRIAKYAGMVQ